MNNSDFKDEWPPEVEALVSLELIVDGAADKRKPVENRTVQKAKQKF